MNAWVREDDQATNEFWEAAYQLASREFPILEMKRRKQTKGQTWRAIRPRDMSTMPKNIYVSLKGAHGYVDLTFGNTTAHLFHSQIEQLLEAEMTVHQTAAAAAIRLDAPKFEISEGLDTTLPKVRIAFELSARLIQFNRKHREELDRQASAATPVEAASSLSLSNPSPPSAAL